MSHPSTKRSYIRVDLPVFFMEEDAQWIAYCPPLDISTYGDTIEDVTIAFEDALNIFLEAMLAQNTLEQELIRLGWTLEHENYRPPLVKPNEIHVLGNARRTSHPFEMPCV